MQVKIKRESYKITCFEWFKGSGINYYWCYAIYAFLSQIHTLSIANLTDYLNEQLDTHGKEEECE